MAYDVRVWMMRPSLHEYIQCERRPGIPEWYPAWKAREVDRESALDYWERVNTANESLGSAVDRAAGSRGGRLKYWTPMGWMGFGSIDEMSKCWTDLDEAKLDNLNFNFELHEG